MALALTAFTDGSALNKGRLNKGSRAAFAVVWPEHRAFDFSGPVPADEPQTNNRGEFTAALTAMVQADQIDPTRAAPLLIYTDSQLLINCMTRWLRAWRANGWRKRDGGEVANLDLIRAMADRMARREIAFRHVKAHTSGEDYASRHNLEVDELARRALTAIT